MFLPIQAAPVGRADRAVLVKEESGSVRPSDWRDVACPACDLLPNPILRAVCRTIACGDGIGGLLGRA